MKLKQILLLILAAIYMLLTSCVTNKKLTYLQSEDVRDEFIAITPDTYNIQPYDNLFVRVTTPDPKWSAMFNIMPTNTQTGTSSGAFSEMGADLYSYSVGDDGTIELPYLGKLIVAGKTLNQVKDELDIALKSYVTDAIVSVKMVNNYVSIIGEVQRPGKYPIYKERLNIFQALAMANDLGTYSDRQRLQIIRQTAEGNIVKEFSVRDRSIIGSQFFYVMPNDVIYAQPMKGKFFRMESFPYALIISSITTFILIWNFVQTN